VLCVLVFPVVTSLVIVFHKPDFILTTVKNSGIYNNVVPAVIDKSKENAQGQADQGTNDLLANPDVQGIIKQSVAPSTLERSVDQIATGVYGWLQGKTPQPEFTIDLSDTKQTLVNNLTTYARDRAAKLPVCTPQQLAQMAPQSGQDEQNVLTITCLPPGVNPQTAAQQFSDDALNNADFLQDTTITSKDVLKSDNGKSPTEKIDWAPTAYHWATLLPWILGIVGALLALAVIFLHARRRRGVQTIGSTLLIIGLLQLSMVVVYVIFFRNVGQVIGSGIQAEFQTAAMKIISDVAFEFVKISGIIAAVYTIVGFVMVVTELKTREKAIIEPPKLPPQKHSDELPAVEKKEAEPHDVKE
jgi:hypothetical protein